MNIYIIIGDEKCNAHLTEEAIAQLTEKLSSMSIDKVAESLEKVFKNLRVPTCGKPQEE